jgi:hypothetical protein
MSSQMIWPGIFVLLLLFTVLLNPLGPIGERIGPGWGDLLNGGLGFVFLIMAAVSALIAARRSRRRQG